MEGYGSNYKNDHGNDVDDDDNGKGENKDDCERSKSPSTCMYKQ